MSFLKRRIEARRLARLLRERARMTPMEMNLALAGRRYFEKWIIPHNGLKRMI